MFRDIQSIPSFVELQCSAEEVLFVLSLAKERRDCPVVRRLRHMLSSSAVKTRGFFAKVSPIWRHCSLSSDGNAESMRGALPCGGGRRAGVVLCPWGVRKFRARRRETVGEGYKKSPERRWAVRGDGGEWAISGCRPWRGGCRSRLCRA